MILPDTSVWIEFFRGRNPFLPVLRRHLELGNVLALDLVFGELLQGARDNREVKVLNDYYQALPQVRSADLFVTAGNLSYKEKAYSRGVGLIDLALICAARESRAKIWSRDRKMLSLLKKEEVFHAQK
ncbi:MAG TPA: PIN domain-containing protein [Turneriella sp.]|nr:PIN domain-containing protein [Turneriella sp.]HNL54884.1 PIN domain-containing protein [Turneriella sp.]